MKCVLFLLFCSIAAVIFLTFNLYIVWNTNVHQWNIVMCDYQESVTTGHTDRQTDRQTPDKVIPMFRYASQAIQKHRLPSLDTVRKTGYYWQSYDSWHNASENIYIRKMVEMIPMLCYLNFNNPNATGYGGDIVTLLWFRPSVCSSRFDLVNMIETKPLCAYSSNLAGTLTMTRGWALLILEVKGQDHNWHIWK